MSLLSADKLEPSQTGITGSLNHGFSLQMDFAESWLLRVAIVPNQGFGVDRTWMIDPGNSDPVSASDQGRPRLSLENFKCPCVEVNDSLISTETLRVHIECAPLRLTIEQKINDTWQILHQDRENGAYQWLPERKSFRHFQTLDPLGGRYQTRHFGLGDKSGKLDRTRRRFKMLQTDALGYDAEHSDPLYKHAPFFMAVPKQGPASGMFYDTFSEISFDFACEHSNYFKPFRHVDALEKGLVYYVIAGPKVSDIVPRLMHLTGMAAMPPRWAMGFAFTAMAHTDAPNAQEVITHFATTMREQKLPISALHFGSGYTQKEDGRRYVFNWNMAKFPDRDGFFQKIRKWGYRSCANVKPVLLTGHDQFKEAEQAGWFVKRGDGSPAIERFWDGAGAQLDFTNPATVNFWETGISQQVLQPGFDGVWNDNNEAELWDEAATLDGQGGILPAIEMRPVHSLLMTKASYRSIVKHKPEERPYTISRAGPIGIARFGETWSGDNETSWHSLKWNLRQGLSMSLSGFPMTGHDIGGFSGPSPSPELLVRWFQMMALHPRSVMNSWKPEEANNTNLPFLYDETTDLVREALNLRYRFLPYLYALAFQGARSGHPLIRPLFYDFNDQPCFEDQDCFMLGKDVLVAPAVEEDQRTHRVYLPENDGGWFSLNDWQQFDGGQKITIDAALNHLPIFIRAGAILPLAKTWHDNAPHDATEIEVLLFPPQGKGHNSFEILLDDGLSPLSQTSGSEVTMHWDMEEVNITKKNISDQILSFKCVTLDNRRLND